MNKSEIQKIILWCIIAISTFIGIITILPFLGYILIICGIVIPSYIIYKNYYKE
tara:strand:+ start:224 stop:385 length:162 start_codon:yes stop_codon:yes gene_type:complete